MRNKILVVDDEAEVVELIRFNLKKTGFVIATAGNGVEALKKARSLVPDLILLDVMMPELDGFALCEILRRDQTTAAIPIIMLTALTSELGRLTGLDSGANAYLTKPFSPRDLVSKVEKLLRDQDTVEPAASSPSSNAATSDGKIAVQFRAATKAK